MRLQSDPPCQGTWREVYGTDQYVVKCDGCGELMVVIGGKAYTYPMGTNVNEAIAQAYSERTLGDFSHG